MQDKEQGENSRRTIGIDTVPGDEPSQQFILSFQLDSEAFLSCPQPRQLNMGVDLTGSQESGRDVRSLPGNGGRQSLQDATQHANQGVRSKDAHKNNSAPGDQTLLDLLKRIDFQNQQVNMIKQQLESIKQQVEKMDRLGNELIVCMKKSAMEIDNEDLNARLPEFLAKAQLLEDIIKRMDTRPESASETIKDGSIHPHKKDMQGLLENKNIIMHHVNVLDTCLIMNRQQVESLEPKMVKSNIIAHHMIISLSILTSKSTQLDVVRDRLQNALWYLDISHVTVKKRFRNKRTALENKKISEQIEELRRHASLVVKGFDGKIAQVPTYFKRINVLLSQGTSLQQEGEKLQTNFLSMIQVLDEHAQNLNADLQHAIQYLPPVSLIPAVGD